MREGHTGKVGALGHGGDNAKQYGFAIGVLGHESHAHHPHMIIPQRFPHKGGADLGDNYVSGISDNPGMMREFEGRPSEAENPAIELNELQACAMELTF